ncbi:DNA topoisomerase [Thermocrinis sp.]|jgi:DNA topoisomerase-3|uniref:DNA topoisomerase n=1 Tax=Thermocrinis sp. TaxID=2024383 RepID=UPI003C0D5AD3
MKTLILTEKPSVAEDFAKALGGRKREGYYEGGEYVITWAFGHLFEISDEDLPKRWDLSGLPIFPEKFEYKLKSSQAGKQFKVIKELLARAEKVIIATDAGREGELIARLILQKAGLKDWSVVYRFWTSSALTPEVIRQEMRTLKPAKEYDSLYWCALARQHADFVVGINLTRAVSLRSNGGVWSVGRVQTPTLALVVQRDLEIENFKPKPYWVIKALFSADGKTYEGVWVEKKSGGRTGAVEDMDEEEEREEEEVGGVFDYSAAEKLVEKLKTARQAVVSKVEKRKRVEYPPPLYSLSSLQRDANRELGFSAQKTLDIAQKLYEERKAISYPRSDAEYLSESSISLVKEVLRRLNREDLVEKVEKVGKRVFDDRKLTDHHAIIPLKDEEESWTDDEKALFGLIKRRFLAAFYEPFITLETTVITQAAGENFYSRGSTVLQLGYRELYGRPKEKLLPKLEKGQKVEVLKVWSEKRWTKPPPRYTEGSLIKKMEKLSLGTPATRAGIIETLKSRGYLVLNKKHLISTEKGRELIKNLQDSKIVSVEMTSEWEQQLESIHKSKKGFGGYKDFLERIKAFTKEEVERIKKLSFQAIFKRKSKKGGSVRHHPKVYRRSRP